MPKNYHELPKEKKTALKPVLTEIRKHLYGDANNKPIFEDGLVINFGKGKEARHTVKLVKVG